MPSDIKRINIWSSPRNVSTALMYSFAQRRDTTVVDEPLYAHYLAHTASEAEHPGREEVLRSQETDGEKVTRTVFFAEYPTPVVVFKQMAHHLIRLERSFLYRMDNVLLIRDPRHIIGSYAKVIPNPTIDDIGLAIQYELYRQLEARGRLAAIVDAGELLQGPENVLRQLCGRLGLPFSPEMLYWPAGGRPEDGAWAPYWYHAVHQSTGFLPYREKEVSLPPRLEELAATCRPYYEEMYQRALRSGH